MFYIIIIIALISAIQLMKDIKREKEND